MAGRINQLEFQEEDVDHPSRVSEVIHVFQTLVKNIVTDTNTEE